MPRKKEPDLVYFEDRGTVYDAPIDALWEFMVDDGVFHPKAHRSTLRKMKWKQLNDITGGGTCEVLRGGKWDKMDFRMTTVAPLVRVQEDFAGSHAGQKVVYLYTPRGKRTTVDVFGWAPRAVAEDFQTSLVNAYEEDLPWLKAFMRARKKAKRSGRA